MAIQFFNFWNRQTFHVFKWVSSSGQVDVKALIAQAFQTATEQEQPLEVDTSHGVRDCLAALLQDIVEEAVPDEASPPYAIKELGDVSGDNESLWQPLLLDVVKQICFDEVAQALLIQAGKWNPDTELPEAI
jgi:hypothetical protein